MCGGRSNHGSLTGSPSGPSGRGEAHALVRCLRSARPRVLPFPGGLDVRQALERPPMPAHARCGHPIKVGVRASQEPWRAARRDPARHVRGLAPRVDPLVQLPALLRQRLPLARPIGGLLGGCGGSVRAYRHPLPAPPGGFPFYTGRIKAWTAHSRLTPSRLRRYVLGRYGVLGVLCNARPMTMRHLSERGHVSTWGGMAHGAAQRPSPMVREVPRAGAWPLLVGGEAATAPVVRSCPCPVPPHADRRPVAVSRGVEPSAHGGMVAVSRVAHCISVCRWLK